MAAVQRHDFDDDLEPKSTSFFNPDYVPGDEFDDDDEEEALHGQVVTDQKMENVVKEIIHNSRRLDGNDISVTVDHGDVTLNGSVRTEEEKYAAGSLTQLVHGVGLIRNQLIVKRNEGILPTDIGRKG